MNTFIRIAIVLLLAGGLAAAGSAYEVETAEVTPDGDLQAGAPVTVSAVVDFPATSGTTFPSADIFSLYSELDTPVWTWAVVIGEAVNPKPEGYGKFFKISGFESEYPKESSVKLPGHARRQGPAIPVRPRTSPCCGSSSSIGRARSVQTVNIRSFGRS